MAQHTIEGGGGLALNVMEWGNRHGRPLLFLHGWSQSHLCWEAQYTSALAEEFRIVTPDNRGHGLSAAPLVQSAYTDGDLWAADVHAVIAALELERPVLVAWSYGGLIAVDYLRVHGDAAIGGINFVGAAVRFDQAALGPLIGPGFHAVFARAVSPDLGVSVDAMREFIDRCFAVKLSRRAYERTLCSNMTVRPEIRAALAAREVAGDAIVAGISVPVLVSHGRRDVTVLPAMSELILAACPQAQASWYEDAAHGPFIEDSARFNRELAEFARAVRA
jgi:non-heme chloroperoxidase